VASEFATRSRRNSFEDALDASNRGQEVETDNVSITDATTASITGACSDAASWRIVKFVAETKSFYMSDNPQLFHGEIEPQLCS
jgi:hypothetical protein